MANWSLTDQCFQHEKGVSFSAQRVGFFNIGSGRVLDKIPGSGSGRSVEKYDRVFPGIFFLSGISGYFGYVGYFWVYLYIVRLFSIIY